MVKNKVYIDVKRTQTMRIEVSETEGYDIPDDMAGFAEFYAELKTNDAWGIVQDTGWDEAVTESTDIEVSIAKQGKQYDRHIYATFNNYKNNICCTMYGKRVVYQQNN